MQPGLTTSERIVIEARLLDAETKYHELATGQAVKRFVDQNGETVEYSAANLGALSAYITSLKTLLNPIMAAYNRPKPIGFLF